MLTLILLLALGTALAAPADIDNLRAGAEAGDAWDQLNLGAAYDHGMGVEADRQQALHWYRRSAAQGVVEAQFSLAHLLVNSAGDLGEAARWMRAAAEQGYTDAQYLYGVMLAEGMGEGRDHQSACLWWQRAADQGHVDARDRSADCGGIVEK